MYEPGIHYLDPSALETAARVSPCLNLIDREPCRLNEMANPYVATGVKQQQELDEALDGGA